MSIIRINIPGVPLPWKSALKGSHGWYSPRHAVNKIIEESIRSQYKGGVLTGPLICDLVFLMPMPKSISKKKRHLMLDGVIRPEGNGDRSNLAKYYEDRMQGIVFANDKQIVGGYVGKWYAEEPSTQIVLYAWDISSSPET